MAKLFGESTNIGVGIEATRGTGVAPEFWVAGRTPTGVQVVTEKTLIQETKGSRISSQGSEVSKIHAEGDLEFNVKNGSIGYILLSLLGTVSTATAAGETVVYEHTFSVDVDNPQNPALTLALSQPNFQDYQYPLAIVSSLEIRTPIDDLVNATVSFMATKENANADYTPAFATDDFHFRHYDVTVKIADTVANLAAATGLCLKEFSMNIANGAEANMCLSSVNPVDMLGNLFEIAGSMKLDYEDETYHDLYTAGTYRAMEISMKRTDTTIGLAENPEVTFTLPKVSFESRNMDRPIDNIVMEELDFTAHHDDTTGYAIQAVVTNEVTDYVA